MESRICGYSLNIDDNITPDHCAYNGFIFLIQVNFTKRGPYNTPEFKFTCTSTMKLKMMLDRKYKR